jgi:hypothetical protein
MGLSVFPGPFPCGGEGLDPESLDWFKVVGFQQPYDFAAGGLRAIPSAHLL